MHVMLICIGSVSCAYAQRVIDIHTWDQAVYASKNEENKRMYLPDLQGVTHGKHWRFWIDKYIAASYILDIYGKDSLHCKAFVTQYVYGDLETDGARLFPKLYYQRIPLDPQRSRALYRAALAVDVKDFSRQEGGKIYMITDSYGPIVEFADEQHYLFRTGLKPNNKAQFDQFVTAADQVLNFEKLKDDFEKDIPLGYYSSSTWEYCVKPLTDEQKKKYIKYWQKKDTRRKN